MDIFTFNVIKILLLTSSTMVAGIIISFFLVRFLRRIKFWKKTARSKALTGEEASVFHSFHKEKEVSTPRGGGIAIWSSILVTLLITTLLAQISDIWWLQEMSFLSRGETWLPLFALFAASVLGLLDDIFVTSNKGRYVGGGLTLTSRLVLVGAIGLGAGLWFYVKLGWETISIPLLFNFPSGIELTLGPWIIPLFVLVMLYMWAGGVIDGIDGLAGGVFASIFAAFTIIAFTQGKFDLATFSAIMAGALLAFLWFNIPPAKFYMGDTGSLGITSAIAVVAFLLDSVAVLPIIAGVMTISVGSVILQTISKKVRKKKIWHSTPIHHHFEALGWPPYKVTMRFWLLSIIFVSLGLAINLMAS